MSEESEDMAKGSVKAPAEHSLIRIIKWRVRKGVPINPSQVVMLYEVVNGADKNVHKLKLANNHTGVVRKLNYKEGDTVTGGAVLLILDDCQHTTVIQDLCADCGADLRKKDNEGISEASVPMVHTIPDLKVTKKLAQKLGKDDTQRLLQDRKLVLLVDLDQTIIHTTNDNIPNNIKDIYHFQLYGRNSIWHHTRLRPGTLHFLEEMSKYYELHICTFGARNYAHMIAQFLDPEGKYFSHRILSRDECFNSKSKFENLSALFPNGDSMVCIIDDREDVWNMASNLIQVKPYHFFQHTGDINAPPGLSKHELDGKGVDFKNIHNQAQSEDKEEEKVEETVEKNNDNDDEKISTEEEHKETSSNLAETADKTEDTTLKVATVANNNLIEIEDRDDYLIYLETILKSIHKRFYSIYDSTQEIPDLKNVVPMMRAEVLRGLNLVFSGLVPVNTQLDQSRAYLIARSLGANVSQNIGTETTHLVALTAGTYKVNAAKKRKDIKIVNSNWLWACAERWEHVDERVFPLDPKAKNTSRQPPSHCHSPEHVVTYNEQATFSNSNKDEKFMDIINPLLSFSNADLADMNKEFEQFFESDSSTDDEQTEHDKKTTLKRKMNIKQNAAAVEEDRVGLEQADNYELELSAKSCKYDDNSSDSKSDNGENIDWTEMGEELERELLRNS